MVERAVTTVLAAVDDTPAATPVLVAAKAMARSIGATVQALHVREGEAHAAEVAAQHAGVPIDVVDGDPIEQITLAGAASDVAVVVIGARGSMVGHRPGGHVALSVVTQLDRPVLLVPPDAQVPAAGRFRRVLIPLEGSSESAEAVAETVRTLAGGGVEIVALHVFRPATAPRFWDHPGQAGQNWSAEFLTRWCEQSGVELLLRSGDVPAAVLDVCTCEDIDLVALGWSQDLSAERAQVVRTVVSQSRLPILLAPAPRTAR